jgi:hypothetical protein
MVNDQYGSKFKVFLDLFLGFFPLYLGLSSLLFMLVDWVVVISLKVEYYYIYHQFIS